MNRKVKISLATVGFLSLLLSGCASFVALKPGAEKVIFTTSTLPQTCRLLGQVSSGDKNGVSTNYISHANLQAIEINTLKNKAVSLGANVVVLTHHQTTYAERGLPEDVPKFLRNTPKYMRVDVHLLVGKAYICPSKVLTTLRNIDSDAISDSPDNYLYSMEAQTFA
jgi:hypothetical protein